MTHGREQARFEVFGGGPDDGRKIALPGMQHVGATYIVQDGGTEYVYRLTADDTGAPFFLLERSSTIAA